MRPALQLLFMALKNAQFQHFTLKITAVEYLEALALRPALLQQFIDTLELPEQVKQELQAMTPASYTGHAEALAKKLSLN